jgi:hypothetical protein
MKLMLLLFIIICLSTVAVSQTKNNSINRFDKSSFFKDKLQAFEKRAVSSSIDEISRLNNRKKEIKLEKVNTTIFKPVKINCDSSLETFTYDNYGNTLSYLSEIRHGGVLENLSRRTYTILNAGKDQIRIAESWVNDKWVVQDRYTVKNDNSGNCLLELYEVWNDTSGSWVNDVRTSFTYNNSGRILTEITEGWMDSVWVPGYRYSYTYDNSNHLSEELMESFKDNAWLPRARYTYTYDASGKVLIASMERILEGSWIITMQFNYNYDSSEQLITRIFKRRMENMELADVAKDSLSYDSNGNNLVEITQRFSGTAWINESRISKTYDNFNYCISQSEEFWSDSIWVNVHRFCYTVDASGNELVKISQDWSDSTNTWMNELKTIYSYDNYGNTIHGENFIWQDSSWVSFTNEFNFGYNNKQDQYYLYSSKADVEYSAFPVTGIEESKTKVSEYNLAQNYPNPFNPSTRITYSLPKECIVTLKVYNSLGEEIATLVNETKAAGKYTVEFNGSNLSSGVYFYKMNAGDFSSIRKLLLLK